MNKRELIYESTSLKSVATTPTAYTNSGKGHSDRTWNQGGCKGNYPGNRTAKPPGKYPEYSNVIFEIKLLLTEIFMDHIEKIIQINPCYITCLLVYVCR